MDNLGLSEIEKQLQVIVKKCFVYQEAAAMRTNWKESQRFEHIAKLVQQVIEGSSDE